ncbi:hypothetical protein [Caulobacter sp. LARHSG274]
MLSTRLFTVGETVEPGRGFLHRNRRGLRDERRVMNSFQIEVDGVRYQGSWLRTGDVVEVRSPYGKATMALEGRDAPAVARELLRRLARPRDAAAQADAD